MLPSRSPPEVDLRLAFVLYHFANLQAGYFPSEMTDRNKTSDEQQKSEFPQEKIENYGHVPIVRPGKEEEMGMTVLFLAKNSYINGQVIAVDGGVLNVVAG